MIVDHGAKQGIRLSSVISNINVAFPEGVVQGSET